MFWTDYIKLEFDIEPFYYFTLTEHEHEQLFKNTVLCNVAVLPQLFKLFKALGLFHSIKFISMHVLQ